MPRIVKQDRGNYTNISNELVRDDRLHWKSRGIFLYLWSQADNWQFYVSEIATHAVDGERALQSGIKELEQYGYLKRVNRQKEGGGFDGMDWILNDCPRQQQNSVNDKMYENQPKNVQNASGAKCVQREMRQTQNSPLRNNNIKNYQDKELSTERININSSGSKQPEPRISQSNQKPKKKDKYTQLYKDVLSYLNHKTGKNYRPSTKSYQRDIRARANEGYKLDDFKKVIDNKCFSWQGKPEWEKYLRPSTLFGTKFDQYLNENDLRELFNKPKSMGYEELDEYSNSGDFFTSADSSEPPLPPDDDLPF